MDNNELYELLDLPEEVIQKLNEYGRARKGTVNITARDLMENDELMRNLDKMILQEVGEDAEGMKILWEELNIARQSLKEYQQKGIPIDIFRETMKLCTRFIRDDHKIYGYYRFAWGWWFPRQLALREFRIGALEYEYTAENCISIHIPSDADLSRQSVLQSLAEFQEFCNQYYPEWEGLEMRCFSWMMSPALKHVLNSDSNILSFQKMFRVVETDYESMAVLDWVFPGFDHVSEELPEKTSLQRRMKKYLLEGKKIGWALGVKI